MAFGKLKNKVESNGEALFYVIPVLAIFGLIYLCSLTFKYVEGDDAASVAFHAFGRNYNLQPPYSPYHGMMDVFLYLLPASESTVRYAAVAVTALSAVVFILLVIDLIKKWLPNLQEFRTALTAIVVLLCTPEIFYLSLFYTPGLTAMCFVLAAHKLLRHFLSVQKRSGNSAVYNGFVFLAAILLFGVGVACRWDIGGLYLIVICADLIFNNYSPREDFNDDRQYGLLDSRTINDDEEIINFQRIRLTVIFAAAAFGASIFAIYLSGYNLIEILNSLSMLNTALVLTEEQSIVSRVGIFQAIFTPALLIFAAVGFVYLLIKRKRSAVFVLITVIPLLIYTKNAHSKMILPALPSIFLAAAAGINYIWFGVSKKYLVLSRTLAVIAIALPWLVGIQINSPNTSWGPGFEIKTLGASENDEPQNASEDKAPGQKLSLSNFRIVTGSGFAIPTPEGARPLGGHFYALIGGQWRNLLEKFDAERVTVLQEAGLRNANILQDSGNSYLVTKLLEMDYRTDNPHEIFSAEGIDERVFTKGNEKIHLQTLQKRSALFTKKTINDLIRYNNKEVILYSGYSSAIKKLKDAAPNAVRIIGPFSAAVNLEELVKSDKLQE